MILIGRGLDFRYDLEPIEQINLGLKSTESKLCSCQRATHLTHVSMCPAIKRGKQASEEEEKDDGANLPEYDHHFRW